MLAQQIMTNWDTTPTGYAAEITALFDDGYPAWTLKTNEGYGVAIPNGNNIEVSESFSGARLYNTPIALNGGDSQNVLLLLTDSETIRRPFAALCAELIMPGENGILRREVSDNPVAWWMQWKELLGNKNVDERVYDALGELLVLKYLANNGSHAVWNGPNGATYDIDADDTYYEVKSSLLRNKRQVTLSNHFQLDPPNGKGLKLVLCQFESAQSGYCIDNLVEGLVELGYSKFDLNEKLAALGLEQKKSARKRCYDLHAMIIYKVDDGFPAVRESSFIGGVLPKGVESISYTLSLDGVAEEKIVEQQVI